MGAKIEVSRAEWNRMQQLMRQKNQSNENFKSEEKVEMQNKLSDLHNHLFAELERLGDEDLDGEALDKELARAKGIAEISGKIIDNANLTLKTAEFLQEAGYGINGTIETNLMGFVGNKPKDDKLLGFKNE